MAILKNIFHRHELLWKISSGILAAGLIFFLALISANMVLDRVLTASELVREQRRFSAWTQAVQAEMTAAEAGAQRLSAAVSIRSGQTDVATQAAEFRRLMVKGADEVWRPAKGTFHPKTEAGAVVMDSVMRDDAECAWLLQVKRLTESFGNGSINGAVCSAWVVVAGVGEVLFFPSSPDAINQENLQDSHRAHWTTQLAGPAKNPTGKAIWAPPCRFPGRDAWIVSIVVPFFRDGKWAGAVGYDLCLETMGKRDAAGVAEGGMFLVISPDRNIVLGRMPESGLPKSSLASLRDIRDAGIRTGVERAVSCWGNKGMKGMATTVAPVDCGECYIISETNKKTGWLAMGVLTKASIRNANQAFAEIFDGLKRSIAAGMLVLMLLSMIFISRYDIGQQRAKDAMHRRLELQQMVANISGRLMKVDIAKMDEALNESLANIGLVLGLDRIVLYEVEESRESKLVQVSVWTRDGLSAPEMPGSVDFDHWPWLTRMIDDMEIVGFSKTAQLPSTAVVERADCEKAGIISSYIMPVKGNRTKIVFWFQTLGRSISWPIVDMGMAKLTCEVMVSAMDYKKAEVAIRESEERFRVALQDSPVAVFSQDLDLQYTWFYNHPSWMADVHVLGRSDEEVYPPNVAERLIEAKAKVLAEGGANRLEITVAISPEQRATYDVTIEPVHDSAGRIIGVTSALMDISEVKRGAEERLVLENGLREAQKLESLAVMAGGIAHDFNNLLMVVLGNAELADQSLPDSVGTDIRDCLQAIVKAGQRASELSRMMLVYSGHSAINPRSISPADVIKDLGGMVDVMLPPDINVSCRVGGETALAELDKVQLQQAVFQLVQNGMEAVGAKPGEIRISSGCRGMKSADFQGAAYGSDKCGGFYAFIEVEDTGCGMDETARKHMFEPFYSTKFTGRGLGLASVLGIVRAHGGAILVRSHLGIGTTISLYFPAREMPTPPVVNQSMMKAEEEEDVAETTMAVTSKGTPGANGIRGTILVVDDEDSIRNLMEHVFRRNGYAVIVANDGIEGLAKFNKNADDISLVILDLKMPRMDGYETMRQLHARRPDLPIILFTGYDEADTGGRFAAGEVAAYIQKPCDMEKILKKVKEVLTRPSLNDTLWLG